MAIMEKIVPPRNSGRNAKRKSGGIGTVVGLLSIFTGISNSLSNDIASLTLLCCAYCSLCPHQVRYYFKKSSVNVKMEIVFTDGTATDICHLLRHPSTSSIKIRRN